MPTRSVADAVDDQLVSLQMLSMIAQSSEFENMAVREEELPELDRLLLDACPFDARGGPENKQGKVCILIQVCCDAMPEILSRCLGSTASVANLLIACKCTDCFVLREAWTWH
jgi:Sec63 Brl domain